MTSWWMWMTTSPAASSPIRACMLCRITGWAAPWPTICARRGPCRAGDGERGKLVSGLDLGSAGGRHGRAVAGRPMHRIAEEFTMFSGVVRPGAGALVEQGSKVLMVLVAKRGLLRWELPAGMANDG